MPAKHTWAFKSRLRAQAFGSKGSHASCRRLKEAVAEIRKAARTDPVIAGDGVVSLMERIWRHSRTLVDTSSQDELLPIAIAAPADRKTRDAF
jgi:hypothetical protein